LLLMGPLIGLYYLAAGAAYFIDKSRRSQALVET
jgi:hypothetical protein